MSAVPFFKKSLRTDHLLVGYRAEKPLFLPLSIELFPGEAVAVIGPNGAGKSTLLRSLAGLQAPLDGSIFFGEKSVGKLSPSELARCFAVALTSGFGTGDMRLEELLAAGRIPFLGSFGQLAQADIEKIDRALDYFNLRHLSGRRLYTLSDGERQQAALARAFLQETPVLLLDEPLSHLDPLNKWKILGILTQVARQEGKLVIFSTHDLEMALQTADRVIFCNPESDVPCFCPEELIYRFADSRYFSNEFVRFDKETWQFQAKGNNKNLMNVSLTGEEEPDFVKKAFNRAGISRTSDSPIQLHLFRVGQEYFFSGKKEGKSLFTQSTLTETLILLKQQNPF